jgi:hypothetical protein
MTTIYCSYPQSTRGPPSLFSTLVYRASSHRRKNEGCPKFDIVWMNLSPIPVGRRGVISSFKLLLPCFPLLEERGVGVGALCSYLGSRVVEAESGSFLERDLIVVVDGSIAPRPILEPRLDAGCAQLTPLLERGKAARLL